MNEKRPTKWTDPKTGKRYVLRDSNAGGGSACEGCVGDPAPILCADAPPCHGAKVWVEDEPETTEKGA